MNWTGVAEMATVGPHWHRGREVGGALVGGARGGQGLGYVV